METFRIANLDGIIACVNISLALNAVHVSVNFFCISETFSQNTHLNWHTRSLSLAVSLKFGT